MNNKSSYQQFLIILILICLLQVSCAKPNYKPGSATSPTKNTEPTQLENPEEENPPSESNPDSGQGSTQLPSTPLPVPFSCDLEFSKLKICAQLNWVMNPNETDEGQFKLKFFNSTDSTKLVELNYELKVILWMPSMGHGSSPTKILKNNLSEFTVYNIYFIMPGEWEIRFQLKEGSNVIDQVIQKITI